MDRKMAKALKKETKTEAKGAPASTPDDSGQAYSEPRQPRGRASFERMMTAAEALLIERDSGNFTLTDVSQIGKVSIGSIYFRFDSKDALLRAVHERVMDRLEQDHPKIVMRARTRSENFYEMIIALVEEIADFLKTYGPIMRPLMMRAQVDEQIRERGHKAFRDMEAHLAAELLLHSDQIKPADPKSAVATVIASVYATLARELGFGMVEKQFDEGNWIRLKAQMGQMAAAFLLCDLTAHKKAKGPGTLNE
jgi:AcrR family transcriptional regulator